MEGQIIKILSNLYFVEKDNKIYECHSRGKFRNMKVTPVVGDFVLFDEKQNYILEILPRKNSLIRPLVSNIDQAFIITSVKEPDFSANLLDKLLVVLYNNNIEPVICFTKLDLLDKKEEKEINKIIDYYKEYYTVVKNTEIEKIKKMFKDKTTVFTGQTGAGKSSLINKLNPNLNLATGEISKALGRGKHTTRHVELISMFDGKVVDTPGFSMIDLSKLTKEEIRESFIEFDLYPCPFRDCNHLNEKECSVKEAVQEDKILASRYDNYQKFLER